MAIWTWWMPENKETVKTLTKDKKNKPKRKRKRKHSTKLNSNGGKK